MSHNNNNNDSNNNNNNKNNNNDDQILVDENDNADTSSSSLAFNGHDNNDQVHDNGRESDGDDSNHSSTNDSIIDVTQFLCVFFQNRPAVILLCISTLLAFGVGITVGVIPDLLSDRFARIKYGYPMTAPHCSSFTIDNKPWPCQEGNNDAQAHAAFASLLLNIFTLICNPVVGTISDKIGRRRFIQSCLGFYTVAPLVIVMMQHSPTVHPNWYYFSFALTGICNFISITYSSMSDIMPHEYRASSFAMILAGFYGAFSMAPSFAVFLNHEQLAYSSLGFVQVSFLVTMLVLPETLKMAPSLSSPSTTTSTNNNDNEQLRLQQHQQHSRNENNTDNATSAATAIDPKIYCAELLETIVRPIRDISILNRNRTLRLLSIASLFASMVFATDANLLLYYIQDQLNVRDDDLAQMFFVMGISGVIFQALLLQPLLKLFKGEYGLLCASFVSGTIHNLLYGLAKNKKGIFIALSLSEFTKTNFPLLSSVASLHGNSQEQGRMQGALFAVNAIGAAIGPLVMQYVYHETKDTTRNGTMIFGPGTMFVASSFLYFMGTICVAMMPLENQPQQQQQVQQQLSSSSSSLSNNARNNDDSGLCDLQEPLLAV